MTFSYLTDTVAPRNENWPVATSTPTRGYHNGSQQTGSQEICDVGWQSDSPVTLSKFIYENLIRTTVKSSLVFFFFFFFPKKTGTKLTALIGFYSAQMARISNEDEFSEEREAAIRKLVENVSGH